MDTGLRVVRRTTAPGLVVLSLDGYVDLGTAAVLAGALHDVVTARPAPEVLTVDCAGLVFCTSSGLNEFLEARRAATARGIAFRLAAPRPQTTRLLRAAGSDAVFEILPADDAA
ncbi:STAS domain-containing protein [Kitasatospora aureofaciens]|uniref:STAS domain-containing protein n=1 Tax=Kitasatospora aureofaciens TaxID=1894 RepID=UPI0033E32296